MQGAPLSTPCWREEEEEKEEEEEEEEEEKKLATNQWGQGARPRPLAKPYLEVQKNLKRVQSTPKMFATQDLFKLSAYKMGVSMRLFKLQFLSSFNLPFPISGENRSLNEHLRASFGLKWAVKTQKPKTGA